MKRAFILLFVCVVSLIQTLPLSAQVKGGGIGGEHDTRFYANEDIRRENSNAFTAFIDHLDQKISQCSNGTLDRGVVRPSEWEIFSKRYSEFVFMKANIDPNACRTRDQFFSCVLDEKMKRQMSGLQCEHIVPSAASSSITGQCQSMLDFFKKLDSSN